MQTFIKVLNLCVMFFLLLSCQNEIIEIPETKMSPSEVRYGSKIKIYSHGHDSLASVLTIKFQGIDDYFLSDSIKLDTIFCTVPMDAISGDVMIFDQEDTIIAKNLIVNEWGVNSIIVTWTKLNYAIDHYNATYVLNPDWANIAWEAEQHGDTVEVLGIRNTGDYSIHHHLFLRNNRGSGKLPEYINAYSVLYNDYGGIGSIVMYPLSRAVINIQDWDFGTLISGRLVSVPFDNNNYLFYVDFSE